MRRARAMRALAGSGWRAAVAEMGRRALQPWLALLLGGAALGAAQPQLFTLRVDAHVIAPEARRAAVRASDAALRVALQVPALVAPPAKSAPAPAAPPAAPVPPVVPIPRDGLRPERMPAEPTHPAPEAAPLAPHAAPLTPPLAPVPREAVPPARTLDPTQMPVEPVDPHGGLRDPRSGPQGPRPEAAPGGGPAPRSGARDGHADSPVPGGGGRTRELDEGSHHAPGDDAPGGRGGRPGPGRGGPP